VYNFFGINWPLDLEGADLLVQEVLDPFALIATFFRWLSSWHVAISFLD